MNRKEIERKIKEGKVLPLTSDIIFKAVFIKEERVLIKILKDVFDLSEHDKPFTILGYETVSSKCDGKVYRGDVLVRLSDKSYVCVEMNFSNDRSAIDRNFVHLTRVHNQMLKAGEEDMDLKQYRFRGLNLNNFRNITGEPIENYGICNLKTGKIATLIYSFCNIDLEKCQELVYDINVSNLPNSVRWGAIFGENDIDKISYILGEDMLTSEEKEEFINTMKEVSNDNNILDDWYLDELAKNKIKCQIDYAKEEGEEKGFAKGKEEGFAEVIKSMLNQKMDYNTISKLIGKSVEEIKKIESSF